MYLAQSILFHTMIWHLIEYSNTIPHSNENSDLVPSQVYQAQVNASFPFRLFEIAVLSNISYYFN